MGKSSFNLCIVLILFFVSILLIIASFVSSLKVRNNLPVSGALPYPGCLNPTIISNERYPFGIYDKNIIFTRVNNITSALEQGVLYVWNVGLDNTPNTRDDRGVIRINSPNIVYFGNEEDYGNLMPKISDRYIVWVERSSNFAYDVKVVDMGMDGILSQTEALNQRVIYSTLPLKHINSLSLKRSKVSFAINPDQSAYIGTPPEIGFCDLSIPQNNLGSCNPQDVAFFQMSQYNSLKSIGDSYFIFDPIENYKIFFNQREYLDSRSRSNGPVDYSSYVGNFISGNVTLLDNSIISDFYESLIILLKNNLVYGYFYPSPISTGLLQISNGPYDTMVRVNSQNSASPEGNYLVAYQKVSNGRYSIYIGSLGTGIYLKTPFSGPSNFLFDSSSNGNHIYTYSYLGHGPYELSYTQCYGI
ncbi:MAG: hypothetical protein AABW89_03075 [Nanoarchaeota archaeon]